MSEDLLAPHLRAPYSIAALPGGWGDAGESPLPLSLSPRSFPALTFQDSQKLQREKCVWWGLGSTRHEAGPGQEHERPEHL